jgi:[ribosomal protein S5]-alanine N-acetyltransferase
MLVSLSILADFRRRSLTTLPETRWFPIRTQRLALREFRADDYDGIHAYASDMETVRFMDWGPNTPEISRARLDLMLKEQTQWPRADVNLAVELVEQSQLIGAARLSLDSLGGADLGYCYGSAFWRKGYGYEAAAALVTIGFEVLVLHRIWATCDIRNTGSIAVLEKLGMRREGTLRKNLQVRDGWRDTHLYAMLDEEWAARRARTP